MKLIIIKMTGIKLLILVLLAIYGTHWLKVELERRDKNPLRLDNLKDSINANEFKELDEEQMEMLRQGRSIQEIMSKTVIDQSNLEEGNPVVDLTNFKDLQYYGPLDIGSGQKPFQLVYDTGSSWLWIPKVNCTGCPPTKNRFDPSTSSTYYTNGTRKDLYYGKGEISGVIATDNISITGFGQSKMNFVLADRGADMGGTQADGIVGLTPTTTDGAELLVDVLYDNGIIGAKEFLVYIGKEGVDKSYIEFGKYQNDTSAVTYVPLKPLQGDKELVYWSAEYDSFAYNGEALNLKTKGTVWDTGTSLLGFPSADLSTIVLKVAAGKQIYNIQGFLAVKWKSAKDIKSVEFTFGGQPIEVKSDEFILYTQGYCIFYFFDLGRNNFILLGDQFLRRRKVIHDVEGLQLGFFNQLGYSEERNPDTWVYVLVGSGLALATVIGLNRIWRPKLNKQNKLNGQEVLYSRV